MPVWRATTVAVLFFGDKKLADAARVLVATPTRDSVRAARSIFPCVNSQQNSLFSACVALRPYGPS